MIVKYYTDGDEIPVWESEPTEFRRACVAWCRAASAAASPIYPDELEHIVASNGYDLDPNYQQLLEIHAEAMRRADWLPEGQSHPVTPRAPELWRHRNTYGLTWHSSVETILARTEPGWVVRIVGEHILRLEAATAELGITPRAGA